MATFMDTTLDTFHPVIQRWFQQRFALPTDAQRLGWPAIRAGRHTLIAAPTGSGKTLAAFLVCIDRLLRDWEADQLEASPSVVYVSPLKALSNDIQRNLEQPLAEISAIAAAELDAGRHPPGIRAVVRTGDTPSAERQAMLRRPPHILVTTPESLYLLVTAEKSRQLLTGVQTVIVDEIHALAKDKRGSHLALTLARLDALCDRPPTRIGLSATQRPIDEIARFLVGTPNVDADQRPLCQIVDVGHARDLDLGIEVPESNLEAVCSHEQWSEIYGRLEELIRTHRSTLVFVNTRRLAERVSHRMTELLGAEAVASHHGSLSRELRHSAERRLKSGALKVIVATASLEMGIDVGFIDLVCQIGSPRSIATFLQRVGRSGHSIGAVPRGRLFPLTRDELLECMALMRSVSAGRLDAIEIPTAPLDILGQQIVAEVACGPRDEDELWELCRSAWPYRGLDRVDFDRLILMLSDGIAASAPRGKHLHRDAIHRRLLPRRGARLTALTSGGAIPETAQFRVVTADDETYVGQLDEDFAIESMAGDIFLLGNNSWQIIQVREGQVLVHDAGGAPPNIPFWFGEAPGRTVELSEEVSRLRADIADRVKLESDHGEPATEVDLDWLAEECHAPPRAADQAFQYVAAQKAAIGVVPTQRQVVFERFFDESGGMQLVIHAPFGSRINRAWGLALRKRFCRSFDFELQAAATDDGIVLSIGPQHSFPIDSLFRIVHSDNVRDLLEQAVLVVPMFQVRWRWNVTRALAVQRFHSGKKVPFYLQRYRSDDLLAAVFPETVGCLENHEGDVIIPDQPLVRQTMTDCLTEAMDIDRLVAILDRIRGEEIELVARETREPSPFCHQLLNANPYAFLDGAALEERRTRAVMTRKGLPIEQLRDLAALDPTAIDQVVREAAPTVRDAEELHEWLTEAVFLPGDPPDEYRAWMEELAQAGRAARAELCENQIAWIAAERWPHVQAIFPDAKTDTAIHLPEPLNVQPERTNAITELLRGWMAHAGPTTVDELSARLGLAPTVISAGLEALEGTGAVMRGHYRPTLEGLNDGAIEWCDRRLLARIHRLTLVELRQRIQPVSQDCFVRFALRHQGLIADSRWSGAVAVREVIAKLQGFELPAGAWESHILPARIADYDPDWLDQLFATGEIVWGRLRPRPREDNGSRVALRLNRSIPVSIMLREDLDWLLPDSPRIDRRLLPSGAQLVYDTLAGDGALFWQQICAKTGLLSAQLEEALRELAAAGLVTCDSYAAVRRLIGPPRRGRRARGRHIDSAPGRWSIFPGPTREIPSVERIDSWCHQLMSRWGVVFRDLLAREPGAPAWHELARQYRILELRGDVRGGRFISGVAGEQFARPDVVDQLRRLRGAEPDSGWIALSGADPLNLVGILDPKQPRLASATQNALIWRSGQCIAWLQGGEPQFIVDLSVIEQSDMTRALTRGSSAVCTAGVKSRSLT